MPEMRLIKPIIIATEEKKLRVAAYCRVSSDSSDQLNSFISQVKHYTEYIKSNPEWELADIYADEGLTGTRTDKREDFNRLMADCRKGKIDRVLVKSISRFSRNTVDCLTAVRELKALGVSICFEKEDIDTATLSHEMVLSICGTLSQEESISISQNMRWSTRKRMANGTFITFPAPYGYILTNGELEITEDKADIVRPIFNSYLSGMGKKQLVTMLNNMTAPKQNGFKKWHIHTVNYILNNERYYGDALFQKSYTTETLPFRKKMNNGELAQYYVQNANLAIISKETFTAAQKLQKAKKISHRNAVSEYSLTHKIKCECSGYFYKRTIVNNNVYWECYQHNQNSQNCPSLPIPESDIYTAFINMVNKLRVYRKAILSDTLVMLETMQEKSTGSQTKIYEIDKQIADLNEQNLVITRLKTKGYIDDTDYISQSEDINQKVNKLRAERRRLLNSDDENIAIKEVQLLCDIFEEQKQPITDFDAEFFDSIIKEIRIVKRTEIGFALRGGLMLTETLPYKERRCKRK